MGIGAESEQSSLLSAAPGDTNIFGLLLEVKLLALDWLGLLEGTTKLLDKSTLRRGEVAMRLDFEVEGRRMTRLSLTISASFIASSLSASWLSEGMADQDRAACNEEWCLGPFFGPGC